jgi:uroporphyrinogen decarboxylase
LNIKKMAFGEPAILHALLDRLTAGVVEYVRYQADAGAHVVQIFDSWGCNLSPCDWDVFSGPYIKRIVDEVKRTHPRLPLILYASGSGGMLERMAATGVDCVSVDQNVDMADARKRLGQDKAVQGNLVRAAAAARPWLRSPDARARRTRRGCSRRTTSSAPAWTRLRPRRAATSTC